MKPKVDLALIDPIDRDNMMMLRDQLKSALVLLERFLGVSRSVLTKAQSRRIERLTGERIEDILSSDEKDVL